MLCHKRVSVRRCDEHVTGVPSLKQKCETLCVAKAQCSQCDCYTLCCSNSTSIIELAQMHNLYRPKFDKSLPAIVKKILEDVHLTTPTM
jgi:hypothetical protein